jgi:hypothetical protein
VKPAVVLVLTFGDGPAPRESLTGFIIDKEGFVVTSGVRAMRGASRITVVINDKDELSAEVVGVDGRHDLVMLKLPARVPHAVSFDTSSAKEGAEVLVTGYPFGAKLETGGLELTATTTKRSIGAVTSRIYGLAKEATTLILLDARLNPGSEGAPVYLPKSGRVIGVVVSALERLGMFELPDLNIAVPGKYVFALAKSVREGTADTPGSRSTTGRRPAESETIPIRRQPLSGVPPPEHRELAGINTALPGGMILVKAAGGALLADPKRPRLYATEPETRALTVVNPEVPAVEKRLYVGPKPAGMAVSPDNSTLYVALSGENALVWVDLDRLIVRGAVRLGFAPYDLACPETGKLYVTVAGGGMVPNAHLIDLKAMVHFRPDLTPGLNGNALVEALPGNPSVLFAETRDTSASIYRCDHASAPLALRRLHEPRAFGSSLGDMRLSADGKRLYVCCGTEPHVQVLDPVTLAPLGKLGRCPYAKRVAPSPDGSKVFVTNRDKRVDVFDAQSFLKIGAFRTPSEPVDVVVSGDSRKLAVQLRNALWIRDVSEMGPPVKD